MGSEELVARLKEIIDKLGAEINANKQQITTLSRRVELITVLLGDEQDEVAKADLNERKSKAEKEIAELIAKNEKLQNMLYLPILKRIDNISEEEFAAHKESTKKEYVDAIEKANGQIKELETRIEEINQEINNLLDNPTDVENVRKQYADLRVAMTNSKAEIEETKAFIKEQEEALAKIDSVTLEAYKETLLSRIPEQARQLLPKERTEEETLYMELTGDPEKLHDLEEIFLLYESTGVPVETYTDFYNQGLAYLGEVHDKRIKTNKFFDVDDLAQFHVELEKAQVAFNRSKAKLQRLKELHAGAKIDWAALKEIKIEKRSDIDDIFKKVTAFFERYGISESHSYEQLKEFYEKYNQSNSRTDLDGFEYWLGIVASAVPGKKGMLEQAFKEKVGKIFEEYLGEYYFVPSVISQLYEDSKWLSKFESCEDVFDFYEYEFNGVLSRLEHDLKSVGNAIENGISPKAEVLKQQIEDDYGVSIDTVRRFIEGRKRNKDGKDKEMANVVQNVTKREEESMAADDRFAELADMFSSLPSGMITEEDVASLGDHVARTYK